MEDLGQEVNQDTLDALETLKDIKEKVKNSNAEIAKKKKIIQQLSTPSCRPITLNPSRVMVQVDMDKDDHPPQSTDHQLDGYMKPCALCSKGFPHKDVILALTSPVAAITIFGVASLKIGSPKSVLLTIASYLLQRPGNRVWEYLTGEVSQS